MRFSTVAAAFALLWAPAALAHEAAAHEAAGHEGAERPPKTELVVTGDKPATGSEGEARARELGLRTKTRPADVLSVVPGLLTVQHAGGGKANQYFLRGFDADHGSDVAVFVDGVPINLPSHAHGQGWIDLHFLIPELVTGVAWIKGPNAVRFGDFATAGAVDLRLADHLHESSATLQAGSFGTFRALLLASPWRSDRWTTTVAGEVHGTDGPFRSKERLRRLNLFARATRELGSGALSFTWMSYAGRWNASGQIPARAVGRIPELPDDFGAIDPTDGGDTQRHQASVAFRHQKGGDEVRAQLYVIRYQFELFSNFSFFANDPVAGDQIAQTDARTVVGAHASFRRTHAVGSIALTTTVGLQARNDAIESGLFASRARARLATTFDGSIAQTGLGAYAEEAAQLLPWLRISLGARLDRIDVRVRDGQSTSAGAAMLSPKLGVVTSPAPFLDMFLSWGRGFHSNDARTATLATFDRRAVTLLAKADAYEMGTRLRTTDRRLELSAALFRVDLESETVWVGDEGTTEARGPTRRIGVELGARARVLDWLWADADVTFTRARFTTGEAVPLAPTRTLSAGLHAKHAIGAFGALRVRAIGARPATEDRSLIAEGWTVVDATLGLRRGPFEAAVDVRNVLGARTREVQFASTSRLRDEPAPVQDLHYTPGWPRTILGRVAVYF
ncbi:MAG: TonB-dependent receptor [Deltaproteobacteria bacterium]|nr:TonB-dependent receptor [Deltaproteobacteria bacterium]